MKTTLMLFFSLLACARLSAQTNNASPYCTPVYNAANPNVYISDVEMSFGGKVYGNVWTVLDGNSGYVFNNNIGSFPLSASVPPVMKIKVSGGIASRLEVFIDYSQNDVFDPFELVYATNVGPSGGTFYAPLQLPDTALYGATRLRVKYTNSSADPCNSNTSFAYVGETEDYWVHISGTKPRILSTGTTNVGDTWAVVNTRVFSNCGLSTAAMMHFEYGTSTAYGQTKSVWEGVIGDSVVSDTLKQLHPNTIYHYRAVAEIYFGGKTYGPDMTFSTYALGVSTMQNELQPVVFPNPSKGVFRVSGCGDRHIVLTLFDVTGRKVYESQLKDDEDKDVSHLKKGLYIVDMRVADRPEPVYRSKLTIE